MIHPPKINIELIKNFKKSRRPAKICISFFILEEVGGGKIFHIIFGMVKNLP